MSFSSGQTVFLCSSGGPVVAKFVSQNGADCVIAVEGVRLPVKCNKLKSSADQCPVDAAVLNSGERVALRIVDNDFGPRVWPATVRKTFANGRVSVVLDGLSNPQSVERSCLTKL